MYVSYTQARPRIKKYFDTFLREARKEGEIYKAVAFK